MMDWTLILAAHGAGDGSLANRRAQEMALQISKCCNIAGALTAFNKGRPGFADVFDRVETSRVVVVPLMTSDGYCAKEVLPSALAVGASARDCELVIARPVGLMPQIENLFVDLVLESIAANGLGANETDVLVIGHGTSFNCRSNSRTYEIAAHLQQQSVMRNAYAGFLDESPFIPDILRDRSPGHLIAIPFLFGGGSHVLEDIPALLTLTEAGRRPDESLVEQHGQWWTILTQPIGRRPRIADLVIATAHSAIATQLLETP